MGGHGIFPSAGLGVFARVTVHRAMGRQPTNESPACNHMIALGEECMLLGRSDTELHTSHARLWE